MRKFSGMLLAIPLLGGCGSSQPGNGTEASTTGDVPSALWLRSAAVRDCGAATFPSTDSWIWRDGAGLLEKDGGLYLRGGWSGELGTNSEVWFTPDAQTWSLVTSSAPWPSRHGAAWLVHRNRLYVIGGDLIDDAWSSVDGLHWRLERNSAPFGKRYTPNAVSDGSRILLYAGEYWTPYDCARSGQNAPRSGTTTCGRAVTGPPGGRSPQRRRGLGADWCTAERSSMAGSTSSAAA